MTLTINILVMMVCTLPFLAGFSKSFGVLVIAMDEHTVRWCDENGVARMDASDAIDKSEMNDPRVEVADIEDWGALQRACPRGVFRDDGTVDADKCTFCGECTRTGMAAQAARVRVAPEEGEFELTVEGTGAMAPRAAVEAAVRALRARLGAVKEGAGAGAGLSDERSGVPVRA